MRLSSRQRDILKQLAHEHFGAGVALLLFGSRADDDKRGGDIDLYVTGLELPDAARLVAKINFVVAAKRQLGEQRIDVVFASGAGQAPLPIQKMAEQTGIPL
ncbi:MAG: nucleotidyltransferase domain-containing protein [Magnetococcus sp. DMHC-1]|nr:nucleotidyltransferase domain-containing protein [Magnetococcales bacterium]